MTLALGALGAFLAFAVGGMVGFASSLLFLPVLLVLGVPLSDAVVLNLALTVLTRLPSVVLLRADLDVARTTAMVAGATPGIAGGVLVAAAVPSRALEVAAGVLVVLSGLHLLRTPPTAPPVSHASAPLLVGACSGMLGVTTSLNGVPPALLLARSGASVRTRLADLSTFFVLGNCLTLVALFALPGAVGIAASPETAAWLAAGMAGNLWGLWLSGRLDERRFDRLTIVLVLVSGVAALAKVAFDAA